MPDNIFKRFRDDSFKCNANKQTILWKTQSLLDLICEKLIFVWAFKLTTAWIYSYRFIMNGSSNQRSYKKNEINCLKLIWFIIHKSLEWHAVEEVQTQSFLKSIYHCFILKQKCLYDYIHFLYIDCLTCKTKIQSISDLS